MLRRFTTHRLAVDRSVERGSTEPCVVESYRASRRGRWSAFLAAGALAVAGAFSPLQAQQAVQRAAVLDFSVPANGDPIQGRKAADALAVELQRSGDYEIVTRQDLERAVATQPGLRPPYNEPTQARLAGAVGARSVFSGRVLGSQVTNRRSARVVIEVRQLDAATGDYINGTQISEVTDDKLQEFDNDVLVDEAINKAAFAAVRSMKQTNLPQGTVLNTTRDDFELNLGTSRGAAIGQRYSVLRDVYNRAKDLTERVKVGEVTVISVEADQSVARLSAGGQAGVRTGDKVRQIYVPSNFPISSNAAGSSSPVTAPPARGGGGGGGGMFGKLGGGLGGIALLVGLVALAGFGGGGTNGSPTPPNNVVAIPIQASPSGSDVTIPATPGTPAIPAVPAVPATPTTPAIPAVPAVPAVPATPAVLSTGTAAIRVTYSRGLPSIIAGQEVVGYLIYRGTADGFSTGPGTLIDFVRGNQTSFTDTTANVNDVRRTVTINEINGGGTTPGRLVINETLGGTGGNDIDQDEDTVTLVINPNPLVAGVQYFYRVARLLTTRTTVSTGTGTGATTTVDLQPVLSSPSISGGGATAIPTLLLDSSLTSNNLDAFTLSIPGQLVRGSIDQVTVQVSTDATFPSASTFVQVNPNQTRDAAGNLVLNLGNIVLRNFSPGDSEQSVFVRLQLRASTDNPGATITSRTITLVAPTGNDLIGRRFLSAGGTGRRSGGLGLPSAPGSSGRFGTRRNPGYILRPR